jgi:hypothetical protein
VIDFQKLSERSNAGKEFDISHKEGDAGEEVICCAEDWDGNMIEATYNSMDILISEVEKEARKVRSWQEDVARSVSGDSSQAGGAGPGNLKRADTFPRVVGMESDRASRPEAVRSSSGGMGFGKGAVIGTLLGAAAGAAFAYAMVRSESPEPTPPMGTYYTPQPPPGSSYPYQRYDHVVERVPARSVVSERGNPKEEDIRPRYVERYTAIPTPGPRELETIKEGGSYISTRSRARTNKPESHYERPLQILPKEASRVERSPESHVSRRSHRSSGSGREKREKGHRKEEGEESFHSAKSSHSESTVKQVGGGKEGRSTVYVAAPSLVLKKGNEDEVDQETVVKVSASRVSVRPSQVPLPESVVEGSRSGRSKAGRTSSRVEGEREHRSGKSRSGRGRGEDGSRKSGVSTRERSDREQRSDREHRHRERGDREREYGTNGAERVELPESVIGGGEYEASVAPSDSVSSVGSKRERLRLVERMRMR